MVLVGCNQHDIPLTQLLNFPVPGAGFTPPVNNQEHLSSAVRMPMSSAAWRELNPTDADRLWAHKILDGLLPYSAHKVLVEVDCIRPDYFHPA
jgi:hypothetical protein